MSKLSKEQSIAFDKFQSISQDGFLKWQKNCSYLKKNNLLLPSGFVAASAIPFKNTKLPRQKHWAWNQSNSKASVRVNDRTVVTFRKISPRKKYSDQWAPNYKIWLFHAQSENVEDIYILWCERGALAGVDTEIGLVFPEQLTLNSFAFLKPFVDDILAQELGW